MKQLLSLSHLHFGWGVGVGLLGISISGFGVRILLSSNRSTSRNHEQSYVSQLFSLLGLKSDKHTEINPTPRKLSLFLLDFSAWQTEQNEKIWEIPVLRSLYGFLIAQKCKALIVNGILGAQDVSVELKPKTGFFYAVFRVDADLRSNSIYKGQVQPDSRDIKKVAAKLYHASVHRLKHICVRQIIPKQLLEDSFEGVREHYRAQSLQEYSRYKNWTRSCYMETHPFLPPQVEVHKPLYECLKEVLDMGKLHFAAWYKELNNLDEVEVVTLNSFVTKYIPHPGKNEFGKHVDGAKIDGSLILALPTDEPHDWPGLLVWDGPNHGTKLQKKRPEHHVHLEPGDACFLDKLVWHHGLPITTGARYVIVCFYKCNWRKVKLPASAAI
mmetsp:Transcript_22619/g.28867  ORF Transcript_22619/g.28867 Transcript_22619/m.28867 type:complete len:384 (+) Transcript_22619:31-1182(+)